MEAYVDAMHGPANPSNFSFCRDSFSAEVLFQYEMREHQEAV